MTRRTGFQNNEKVKKNDKVKGKESTCNMEKVEKVVAMIRWTEEVGERSQCEFQQLKPINIDNH